MDTEILPLSEVAKSEIKNFLRSHGQQDPMIEWKYFDFRFNGNHERGYVAVRDGRVCGFLGMIPFDLGYESSTFKAAWTCDWYVDNPASNGVLGLRILKRAITSNAHLMHMGGNNISQGILARVAQQTVPDAGIVFHLNLRLGNLFKRAGRRFGLKPLHWGPIEQIPLGRLPQGSAEDSVMTESGIPDAIMPILEAAGPGKCYPKYDLDYIDWQIGRCPNLSSFTCYVSGASTPQSAAIFWRPADSTDFWRMVLFTGGEDKSEIASLLATGIRQVYDQKGMAIRTLVSRLDTELIGILEANGFFQHRRLPFHVLSNETADAPLDAMSGLSYLDGDHAYIFE